MTNNQNMEYYAKGYKRLEAYFQDHLSQMQVENEDENIDYKYLLICLLIVPFQQTDLPQLTVLRDGHNQYNSHSNDV